MKAETYIVVQSHDKTYTECDSLTSLGKHLKDLQAQGNCYVSIFVGKWAYIGTVQQNGKHMTQQDPPKFRDFKLLDVPVLLADGGLALYDDDENIKDVGTPEKPAPPPVPAHRRTQRFMRKR